LGTFYQDGIGVKKNNIRAEQWLNKAVANYEISGNAPEDLNQRYQQLH
jgi:TPR repeat protein